MVEFDDIIATGLSNIERERDRYKWAYLIIAIAYYVTTKSDPRTGHRVHLTNIA